MIWETTRACELACVHCRASANERPEPDELTPEEGLRLVQDIKEAGASVIVFSGGNPFQRRDLTALVSRAKDLGMRTGTIPAVTPLVTRERLQELKQAGLDQIAFSLDAASPEEHDGFRRTEGVFARTLEAVKMARETGLGVQINSLINVHNREQLISLIRLIETMDLVFWEVFFLVPVGRGTELRMMEGEMFEEAFERIYELNKRVSFVIKVTEAPHYRRYYFEREKSGGPLKKEDIVMPSALMRARGPRMGIGHAPGSVNAGKGFAFISYNGEVFPSGFLPVSGGNIRHTPLKKIYRDAPVFRQMRDSSLLKGRCGICSYRDICGGSRSRAYAMTGDYLAEDPCCVYQPEGMQAVPFPRLPRAGKSAGFE